MAIQKSSDDARPEVERYGAIRGDDAGCRTERLAPLTHMALHPRELDQADLKALRDVVVPEKTRGLDYLLD